MIAIVTDSTVGYSTQEVATRGIVTVVPVNYQIGRAFFEEYASDRNGAFLPLIEGATPCKTAQPTLGNFLRTFGALVQAGHQVVCILLSSALSGTCSSARFAADQVGGQIAIIDSQTIGDGLRLLVDEAVNMAKGGFSFEDICKNLETLKEKVGSVFTVETLAPILAGGRLNDPKAKTTLNLRPVFEVKGKILFRGNARGTRERLEQMLALVPATARRIIVSRCGESTDVAELTRMLKQRHPQVYIHQRVAGPVLSIHTGRGAFGIAYIRKD